MPNVVDISPTSKHLRIAQEHRTDMLSQPTAKQKDRMEAKRIVAKYIEGYIVANQGSVSLNEACGLLRESFDAELLPSAISVALKQAWPTKAFPSRATLYNLMLAHQSEDSMALAPKHRGRIAKNQGWHNAALVLWGQPQKPAVTAVARELMHGGFDVSVHQVRYFINQLPDYVKNARRLGPKLYRDSMRKYRSMNYETLNVGDVYQGDGHTIDVYLAHPVTGNPYRPELSAWIDLRSRYVPGLHMSEAESSISTLFSLSKAMLNHNHLPLGLHIDNGSGYISKLMNDKSEGFYAKFGIEPLRSLPGNSKGKGVVERFFRTLRDQHDKRFHTYCGHDMSDEALKKALKDAKRGERALPTLEEYFLSLTHWVENEYHHQEHRGIDGKTPAQMWEELDRFELDHPAEALIRPRTRRTIQREEIRIHGRRYRGENLLAFNSKEVIVEYDLFDDEEITLYTIGDERYIGTAALTARQDYQSHSRIQDKRIERARAAEKRLEVHIQEKLDRSRNLVEGGNTLEILDDIAPLQIENDYAQIDELAPSLDDGDLLRDSVLKNYEMKEETPGAELPLEPLDY